jgi:hypothetical protein
MRQVQESPTDYQGEYEYANPCHHCRKNVPQKTHLAEQHISKKQSVPYRHLDCQTSMRGEDQQRLGELLQLQHRPLQFCPFLVALVREKQLEALMIAAIRQCRQLAAHKTDI